MNEGGANWTDIVTAIFAGGAVTAAVAVPLTSYARRPALSIVEDRDRLHSAVEGDDHAWVRLVVANKGWRRASKATRVVVDYYRENAVQAQPVTLGAPELGWTSLMERPDAHGSIPDGALIFAGGVRPVDFGELMPFETKEVSPLRDEEGKETPATVHMTATRWCLRLGVLLAIRNRREYLRPKPNGYIVALTVGSDDGKATSYDVHVNWNDAAATADEALASVQVEVQKRRR